MPGGFEKETSQPQWTWVPPWRSGKEVAETPSGLFSKYDTPDGPRVSFGYPQDAMNALKKFGQGIGAFAADPAMPKGYAELPTPQESMALAGGAMTGALGMNAARAPGQNALLRRATVSSGGAQPNDYVTLYHGTTREGFEGIHRSGFIEGPAFLTPRRSAAEQYSLNNGDQAYVVSSKVPESHLKIDLDMPGARLLTLEEANGILDTPGWTIRDHISAGRSVGVDGSVKIER